MSKVLITESILSGIADAIREKDGSTAKITPANMATKISAIETGGDTSGLEATIFSNRTTTTTKPAEITCENVTNISSFINFISASQDYYFPNVTGITSTALQYSYVQSGGSATIHLNADYKADIQKSTNYPTFGGNGKHSIVFDINAVKLTLSKPSDVTKVWVNDIVITKDYEYITKSKDTPIVALSSTALLVDSVNTATDKTYAVTMPTTNPVGINVTGTTGTATTTIKYGTKSLGTKSGLNPQLYCSNGVTLSYAMKLALSTGQTYVYEKDLNNLVSITLADMTEKSDYFVYKGTTYYISDSTLTSFEDVGGYIYEQCGTYFDDVTVLHYSGIEEIANYSGLSNNYIREISLPVCTSVGDYAFYSCSSLTSVSLPKCTSVGDYAFDSCSKLTEIHFAAANQSKIEASSSYSSKWGADNATIYFDL